MGEEYYEDSDGQLSLVKNFDLQNPEYNRISNFFINYIGSPNVYANLLIKYGIVSISKRVRLGDETPEQLMKMPGYSSNPFFDFSEGLIAEISLPRFMDAFCLNRGGRTYRAMEEALDYKNDPAQLLKVVNAWQIIQKNKETGEVVVLSVLDKAKYDPRTRTIFLKFRGELEQELIDVKKNFTQMSLPVLGLLREDFTERLYERLKSKMDYDIATKYNGTEVGERPLEVCLTYDIDELFFMLNIYPVRMNKEVLEDKYHMDQVISAIAKGNFQLAAQIEKDNNLIARYSDDPSKALAVENIAYFKRHYLDKAIKKINGFAINPKLEGIDRLAKKKDSELCNELLQEYYDECRQKYPTDIHIRYTFNRNGLGGKIASINFYVCRVKELLKYNAPETTTLVEKNVVDKQEGLNFEQMKAVLQVDEIIFEPKLTPSEAEIIARAADFDIERVRTAYEVAKQQTRDIDNFVQFMKMAIIGRWEPKKSFKAVKQKAQYSYDAVREQLGYESLKIWIEEGGSGLEPSDLRIFDRLADVAYRVMNSEEEYVQLGNRLSAPTQTARERITALDAYDVKEALLNLKNIVTGKETDAYYLTILFNQKLRTERSIDAELKKNNLI